MPSSVFFIDLRATVKENFVAKLKRLLDAAGLPEIIGNRDLTAIKLHFGERGNTAYIRPVYVAAAVDRVRAAGGVPFLTDANTLYSGSRSDAAGHLETAIRNGFAFSVVGAPLVIADGLRGKSETAVPVAGRHVTEAYIGNEIVEADALISLAHFKGHELSGFGGAIKNVGMGGASRRGKMAQHSSVTPAVKEDSCVACGECEAHCAQEAIAVVGESASIDPERCIGCGECIIICPNSAVTIQWNQSIPVFMENMVDYTAAVLKHKVGKALFVNFITDVSPACDCLPTSDAPIVRNIGVVAAVDPVAVDQASVDRVNREPALAGSCLDTHTAAGEDKFRGLYPKVDWAYQLAYGERIGLGRRDYEWIDLSRRFDASSE